MKSKIIKGLFCFDGPIYKDKDGNYCSITINNQMLSRYLDVCDHLYLIVRTFNSDKSFSELNMPKIENDRITIIDTPNYYSLKYLINSRSEQNKIEEYVKQSDLIFARMPSQTSNIVLKVVKKMKKPYLVEVGGCAWDSFFNHSFKGKLLAPYMYLAEKNYVYHADYASYVTKNFLQKRYPNKSNNQINCSNVYILPEVKNVRKYTNNRPISIGTATNSIDVKYKGQDSVIRALSILKNKYNETVYYDIVGPGEGFHLKELAKKLNVENQVRFLGTKNKLEMNDWLANLDIYIQPSKQEGLPRSVIEAMSFGKYILGSSIAGIPELIDQNFLFNPGNYQQITALIAIFLKTETSEINKISMSNFEKSLEYSVDKLNLRRKKFFNNFKNYVMEGNK
ncbi:glycosyltransferase [Streptococcus sp. A34]|uniref:glycosyltransferase n=1 Tax=Streptococcus sp. A34 TaxID=3373130 RepID=UPI00374CCA81